MDTYEQDVAILQLLAKSHLQANDPFTATVILLNAYELDSQNADLLDLYFNISNSFFVVGNISLP